MSEDSSPRDAAEFERPIPLLLIVGVAILGLTAAHLGLWISRSGLSRPLGLLDPDGYMWLNRVVLLAESGGWFDHVFPRINPPVGHEQHWTRPLDALLLAGGKLLSPIFGFRSGLLLWAVAIAPLLHVLSLLLIIWCAGPLVKAGLMRRSGLPILAIAFVAQLGAYQPFYIGRPDHHALLAFLFLLHLGLWLRVMLDPDRGRGTAIGLGLVAAAAVWVNVEALVFVAFGMLGLGLQWLWGKPVIARANADYGAALLGGSAVALFLEWGFGPPPVRAMDTLSVAHVALFGLVAAFWRVLLISTARQSGSSLPGRAIVASFGAVGVLGLLALTFPEFYGDPLANTDPVYRETRLKWISELQPIASLGSDPWQTAGAFVAYIGTGVLVLAFLAWRVRRGPSAEERILFAVLGTMVLAYTVLAIGQVRWTDYVALSAVIPFSLLVLKIKDWVEHRFTGREVSLFRPLFLALVFGGPLFAGLGAKTLSERPEAAEATLRIASGWEDQQLDPTIDLRPTISSAPGCDLVTISQVLADERWFAKPTVILAHTDYGPELLFRTHHSVLSIPNHRPQPGYLLMREIFGSGDPADAATLLRDREVGAIVLCASDIGSGFLFFPDYDQSFVSWLARGGIPAGFTLHAATPHFRVYRAKGDSTDG